MTALARAQALAAFTAVQWRSLAEVARDMPEFVEKARTQFIAALDDGREPEAELVTQQQLRHDQ